MGSITERLGSNVGRYFTNPLRRGDENYRLPQIEDSSEEDTVEADSSPVVTENQYHLREQGLLTRIWYHVMTHGYEVGRDVICQAPKLQGDNLVTMIEVKDLETSQEVKQTIRDNFGGQVAVRIIDNKKDASKKSRLVEVKVPITKQVHATSATVH